MSTSQHPNPAPRLPEALQRHPELDSWVRIDPADTITILTGKVEIGQGIRTTVAQIVAEELDVSMERMRVILADTGQTPDEGYTAGSNSTRGSGGALRQVAAEVRAHLLEQAAAKLDAPVDRLQIRDGTITDPHTGRQTDYWQLHGGKPFRQRATGRARRKDATAYTLVSTSAPRLDFPGKVTGHPAYVDDMRLPNMVHGRVVRPPVPQARLRRLDEERIAGLPGVLRIVRDGNFLAVIAEREEQALAAATTLAAAVEWEMPPPTVTDDAPAISPLAAQMDLASLDQVYQRLLRQPSQDQLIVDGAPVDEPPPPPLPTSYAAHTLDAVYLRPFQMHAALGPSSALAQLEGEMLTVWSHSQGVFPLREGIAQVLEMPPQSVRVIHTEGPGCYGHNGADDVALDAALLAQAMPGRPVLLKWTREDEHRWEPFGPAMAIRIQAGVDEQGRMAVWNHDVWSYPHSRRPRPVPDASGLLAAQELGHPWPAPAPRPGSGSHNGGYRNADPLYNFANRRIVKHFVADSPVRTSSLRSLGAYANVFAIESALDELAHAAGLDPVAFRLRHLDDARARAVIQAATARGGWQPDTRGHLPGTHRGQGVAFAQYKNEQCYAAVVADVHVDVQTGVITVERAVIGGDAGQIINPDGLSNQLEGGVVQATGWTLKEWVRLDDDGSLPPEHANGWEGYPVLRFHETPVVETVLLNQPGAPVLGAGEATQGPTAAAIANAVFAAVGIRLREIPFTPARVLDALARVQKKSA